MCSSVVIGEKNYLQVTKIMWTLGVKRGWRICCTWKTKVTAIRTYAICGEEEAIDKNHEENIGNR